MIATPSATTWRPLTNPKTPRLRTALLAGLLLAAAGERASAAGSICRQECRQGPCAQTLCAQAGPAGGYCRCSGGSQSWDGATYSSWCVSWGQPLSSCAAAAAVLDASGAGGAGGAGDAGGSGARQPAAQITELGAMTAALRTANPWVATLLGALHDGARWVNGPAQGLVHDSYFDAASAVLSHAAAVPFTAQVTGNGLGTVRIDILVAGDVAQLSRLKAYVDATTPGAIPPRQVHGAVTAGGLYGSLLVTAADGRTQAVVW